MKYSDIKALTLEERKQKRREIELELMKERSAIVSGTAPKNAGLIREMRKDLARLNQANAEDK